MSEANVAEQQPVLEAQASPDDYSSEKMAVLRDAAHIRRRPGVYIGDTGTHGLHHLVFELVHNSIDEALAGFCKTIVVQIDVDGSVTVSDDGRGIPVDPHPELGKPTLEVALTVTGAGAKFDKRSYKTSAGLHGMGAKAVTALSEWVEAEVRRNGKTYVMEFERGKATTGLMERGPSSRNGTTITFSPDPEIFSDRNFKFEKLADQLRELSYLNKGVSIKLIDKRTGQEETFLATGGLAEFVTYLARDDDKLHEPIHFEKTVPVEKVSEKGTEIEDVKVEAALLYTMTEGDRIRCYANNAYNFQGGTHLTGLRTALTRTLGAYGQDQNFFKNVTPTGADFSDGLTAVVSVHLPEPLFESQTKVRLTNPEVAGVVQSVVNELLGKFLEENPKEAKKILSKIALAAEAREAARKAKQAIIDRKKILGGGGLPGKLMDCTTRDRDASELFLVEGQSAGGSAESGRDRFYQAILPLRGKVLNVEKARPEKFLGNEEICNLISAVGVDIGADTDLENLRYGKIVILTDADVDGQHIRTLLLTFFYRQMGKLVEAGHVYVARPPLYKVTQKKQSRYINTIEEMQRELMSRGLDGTALSVLPAMNSDGTPGQGETKEVAGEALAGLIKVLVPLEEALQILERRGVNLVSFLQKITDRGLPAWKVVLGNEERWLHTSEEVDAFRREKQETTGQQLTVEDETALIGNGHTSRIVVHELHEVRGINRGLEELRQRGLRPQDLIPLPRVAGREPPPRFILTNGEQKRVLPQLRELIGEVRKIGERGLAIMRFKGLGEMNAEELWETTLDPQRRTLLQVKLDDVMQADEIFRTLMGEKVEPRRDFIQSHALDVKEIDYHSA